MSSCYAPRISERCETFNLRPFRCVSRRSEQNSIGDETRDVRRVSRDYNPASEERAVLRERRDGQHPGFMAVVVPLRYRGLDMEIDYCAR